jgi:oligopeptide transport system substrate-binding protein
MTVWQKNFIILGIGFLIQASSYADSKNHSSQIYVKSLYSLPLSLDPIQMNDTASLVVGNLIYDGLLKFSPTLKLESAIAESWSTSKDGKILTFKIRANAKFHDGSKIKAQDAVTSLMRALSSESIVRKYYDCILGADENKGVVSNSLVGLKAIDEDTLQIILKHPFPPFLSVLAGATAKILPAKYLNNPKFFQNPIGSGAFKYSGLNVEKKEITVNAFNEYYAGAPNISKMILKESTEEDAIKLASNGEIQDLANWPLTLTSKAFLIGKRISSPVAATWIIGINTTKKPFNDLSIRQMFKASVDTEGFRLKFYPDALPALGYVPHGLPGSEVKFGLKIKKVNPPKNKISIVIPKELVSAEQIKLFIESDLQKKGWNVEVVLMAWDQLMDGYSKKAHQAFLVSMNMDYPDAEFLLKNFESTSPDNFSGLKNKKLDSLLKETRGQQDRKKREYLYREALKLTEESAVTVNLFHPRANYWVSSCVEGFQANILSDVYIDYSKISLNPKCVLENAKNVVKK